MGLMALHILHFCFFSHVKLFGTYCMFFMKFEIMFGIKENIINLNQQISIIKKVARTT